MNLRIEDNLSMMDPFMSSISTLDLPPFWPTPSSSAACHVSPSHPTQETFQHRLQTIIEHSHESWTYAYDSPPSMPTPAPSSTLGATAPTKAWSPPTTTPIQPRYEQPPSCQLQIRPPPRVGPTLLLLLLLRSSSYYPFFLSIIIISSSIMNVVIVTWQVEGGTSPERLRGWRLMEGLLEEWVQVMLVGVCGDQLERQLVRSVMED